MKLSASQILRALWAARRFGRNRAWAQDARQEGETELARKYAKDAREDWEELKTLVPEILKLHTR